jgi:hypothetical protein
MFFKFFLKSQPPELVFTTLIIKQKKLFRCTYTFMHRTPGVTCVQLCTAVRSAPLNVPSDAHLLI